MTERESQSPFENNDWSSEKLSFFFQFFTLSLLFFPVSAASPAIQPPGAEYWCRGQALPKQCVLIPLILFLGKSLCQGVFIPHIVLFHQIQQIPYAPNHQRPDLLRTIGIEHLCYPFPAGSLEALQIPDKEVIHFLQLHEIVLIIGPADILTQQHHFFFIVAVTDMHSPDLRFGVILFQCLTGFLVTLLAVGT